MNKLHLVHHICNIIFIMNMEYTEMDLANIHEEAILLLSQTTATIV